MRRSRIATSALAFLSCGIVAAACVQVPETESGSGPTSAVETRDSEDTESEPGGSSGEESPVALVRDLCIAAVVSIDAREAFCRSILVPPYTKQACWARVLQSPASWIGWCSWAF